MTLSKRIILAIETSCDETAVALLSEDGEVVHHCLYSQEIHAAWGGVVPEAAARAHAERLPSQLRHVLREARCDITQLGWIAATAGPGLMGGLMVGVMMAKAMAMALGVPFVAVNHLEGHLLSARIENMCPFPYGMLLVSGGHTELWLVEDVGVYRHWGRSLDDAAGEAFDKTARLLGLGYPGGALLEQWAARGRASDALPRPRIREDDCDFSFSGLKTAVAQLVAREKKNGTLSDQRKCDIAAAVQESICDVIENRCRRAMKKLCDGTGRVFAAAGGVAANKMLRQRLQAAATDYGLSFVAPPNHLCTDNAIMIGWVVREYLKAGLALPSDLTQEPHPRLAIITNRREVSGVEK